MGLFGGGSKTTTSTMTRPDYIQRMIDQLASQSQNTKVGGYQDLQTAGLNENELAALESLKNSPEINKLAAQLTQGGQEGLNTLNQAYSQLQDLYANGRITPDKINALANQLYDSGATQEAINAQNQQTEQQLARATLPEIAQQTMQGAGQGSSGRMQRDFAKSAALTQEQQDASNLTNQAYQNAVNQANSVLSGNRQQQMSALGALTQNAEGMSGLGMQGAQLYNQANMNALKAGQIEQAQQQIQNQNDYQNALNRQNWGWNQINNQLGAANVLNAAQGQTTKTTVSGGGGGILGGAMSGAAAGSAFGPWGALAGAVIGGVAGASN